MKTYTIRTDDGKVFNIDCDTLTNGLTRLRNYSKQEYKVWAVLDVVNAGVPSLSDKLRDITVMKLRVH